MSNEKHLKARIDLGLFFTERRQQMGHNCKALANFVGITENTMQRIEAGAYDYDIMLMFKICEALEIKPFFILKEFENTFTDQLFGSNLN